MSHSHDQGKEPLVSVLVYNYNYGSYLRECLQSIIDQTYSNIEINFSDNASTDNSWKIALDFQNRFPDKISVTRNRKNFGADDNFRNCMINARGKYFVNMCSDDVMAPNYIQRAVETMETQSDLGFVIVHRSILNEKGDLISEPPFYNQNCIIKGEDQAAVYMMAGVNPSVSQVMYNRLKTSQKYIKRALNTRWYGCRIMDFNICMEYPVAYLAEPLLKHRIHGDNDSLAAADNLMEIIGPYILAHQYADISKLHDSSKALARLDEAINKQGKLAIRYCARALNKNNEVIARKYYHLAQALSEDLSEDRTFLMIEKYWKATDEEKREILKEFNALENVITRAVSYDPPEGSLPI